jgi:hypothetical protein
VVSLLKALAAAVVLAAAAWLIGESADSVGPIQELAVIFVVPIIVALAAFALMRRRNILIAVALGLIWFGAAYGGRQCFARAYNGCVGNADDIKGMLDRYRRQHFGRYPAKLEDALPQPPCRRCLRGTILRYSSTQKHYAMSFSDSVVSWETTDNTSWSVGK